MRDFTAHIGLKKMADSLGVTPCEGAGTHVSHGTVPELTRGFSSWPVCS